MVQDPDDPAGVPFEINDLTFGSERAAGLSKPEAFSMGKTGLAATHQVSLERRL
jgi:hypothetical protein